MSRHILVVEDSNGNRHLALRMLSLWRNLVVYGAESGEIALDLAEQIHFDTILLDIGLPGIRGVETYQRLRARPSGAALRIIACTAFAGPEDHIEFRQLGFDAILTKPFLLEELSEVLGMPAL